MGVERDRLEQRDGAFLVLLVSMSEIRYRKAAPEAADGNEVQSGSSI